MSILISPSTHEHVGLYLLTSPLTQMHMCVCVYICVNICNVQRVETAQEMFSGALGLSQVGFPAGLGESTGKDDKGCILIVTANWLVLGIYPVAAPPIGSVRSGM